MEEASWINDLGPPTSSRLAQVPNSSSRNLTWLGSGLPCNSLLNTASNPRLPRVIVAESAREIEYSHFVL